MAGARMPGDVGQHLLKDAEHRDGQAPFGRQHVGRDMHLEVHLPLIAAGQLELLGLPLQRGPQALMIEDAGAQVRDDAAHRLDGRVHQPAHALAFAHHGLALCRVAHAAGQPVEVHLQRHQQRAQLVVDLAGDALALGLAHGLQVVGQLAQLGGAAGHALLQLVMAGAQQRLGLAARRDVDEGDDGALHHAMLDDRIARILRREGAAIGPPQHLVVDAAGVAATEGVEDGAVALGVVRAVLARVVDQLVHVAAQHLLRAPAQGLQGGAVDEGAAAGHVDAEDAFARAFQQQRGGQGVVKGEWHAGEVSKRRAADRPWIE